MKLYIRPAALAACQALLGGIIASSGAATMAASTASGAGITTDAHGNTGYASAAECDAALLAGTAKTYQPFTSKPALKLDGEVDVKQMKLGDLPGYAKGACDRGVGHRNERDGVSAALIGRWIPFSPDMPVNVYMDAAGKPVRATMQQCDNNFAAAFPRPVASVEVAQSAASECYAYVLKPAKFEDRAERVLKVPATKTYVPVPPTFKTITEQVMVVPALKRQIPIPATYKEITERVVIQPESTREEPVAATFKTVTEQVVVVPEKRELVVVPGTFKTVTERVMIKPERKELKVIAAEYGQRDEDVIVTPATTRVETIAATYKTVEEQVVARPESVRYEPITLPMKTLSERVLAREASAQLAASASTLKTVTEQILVREQSKRLVEVPAVYETVTERVLVKDSYKLWKRGRAFVGQALEVRPLRGFVPGSDGKVDGFAVDLSSSVANNARTDDDVLCLVEIAPEYQTITKQVLKSAATVREEIIPAEYKTVTRQVLDQAAGTTSQELAAQYQTVTRRVIDLDKLKADGYRFDDKGELIASPSGERILRASSINGTTSSEASAGFNAADGYVREIKVPALMKTVSRQVVDQPASVRTVAIPAVTKKVSRTIVVKPARTEEVVIPAEYAMQERQVVDRAATTREVVTPPVYKTVTRQVVDQPATTRKVPVPAVYGTVSKRVIDTEATVREEEIAPVYKTVTRQVIDQPATVREVEVPAQYETVTQKVMVSEGSVEQRSVLCETNATPAKIMQIQQALKAAGQNPGAINGKLGEPTMRAVLAFQKAKGLPTDGFLNLETVKALGVSPN